MEGELMRLIIYILKIEMERGVHDRFRSIGVFVDGDRRKISTKSSKTTTSQAKHILFHRDKLDKKRICDTKVVRYQGWFQPSEAAMTEADIVRDWTKGKIIIK